MQNLKLCQCLFIFCYMKIHCSLYSLHFARLFLACAAFVHWLLAKYGFAEVGTQERMSEKTTVSYYSGNSFDLADPL